MADLPLVQTPTLTSSPYHSLRRASSPTHSLVSTTDTPQHQHHHSPNRSNGHIPRPKSTALTTLSPTHTHTHTHTYSPSSAPVSPDATTTMTTTAPTYPSPPSSSSSSSFTPPVPPPPAAQTAPTTPTTTMPTTNRSNVKATHSLPPSSSYSSNKLLASPGRSSRYRSHDAVTSILDSGPSFIKKLFPRKKNSKQFSLPEKLAVSLLFFVLDSIYVELC